VAEKNAGRHDAIVEGFEEQRGRGVVHSRLRATMPPKALKESASRAAR
jgi:hypothetical protein